MVLDEIVEWKVREVEAREAARPFVEVERAAKAAPRPRPFEDALSRPGRLSILAEIKRRSPSAGVIRKDVDVSALARSMEAAGAQALSVLTDEKYFGGLLSDLSEARAAVAAPVLEKDFVIDRYQVHEARAAGADAVLLIVRILEDAQMAQLYAEVKRLGMGVLVEVHSESDLERAMDMDSRPRLVGINNRDLDTLAVDLNTTLGLMPKVPEGVAVVSQSGISTPAEVKMLYDAGVSALQVGESIMRSANPEVKIRELLSLVPRG